MNTSTLEPQSPKTQLPVNVSPPHRTAIIVSILATILLASIGLTIYQLKQQEVSRKSEISLTPTVGQSPSQITPDEDGNVPADWKTYTDSVTQYSFKYPSDWNFIPVSEGCGPVFTPDSSEKFLNSYWLTICGPYINIDDTPEDIAQRTPNRSNISNVDLGGHKGVKVEVLVRDNNVYSYSEQVYIGNIVSVIADARNGKKEITPGTIGIILYVQDKTKVEEAKNKFSQILSTFNFTISDQEKLLIDSWLEQNNLNQYGDSKDTMYAGGTPLFDERTGDRTDRYEYILKKFPERPWSQ